MLTESAVFLRVIWLHLRVCWQRTPSTTILAASTAAGVIVPVALVGATAGASGYSYALGPTCFIDARNSFAVFWVWMVGVACASLALQLVTTGYCVWVFVDSHRLRAGEDGGTLALPTGSGSSWGSIRLWRRRLSSAPSGSGEDSAGKACVVAATAAATAERWRAIRGVLRLQWRIVVLTVALVIECVYFSSQGWAQEKVTTKESAGTTNPKAVSFGACLVSTRGNRTACLPYAAEFVPVNKPAVLAGIFVMAVSSILLLSSSSNIEPERRHPGRTPPLSRLHLYRLDRPRARRDPPSHVFPAAGRLAHLARRLPLAARAAAALARVPHLGRGSRSQLLRRACSYSSTVAFRAAAAPGTIVSDG